MPHTKSAKKSIRQDAKRRARNRAVKKAVKLQVRAVLDASKAGGDKLLGEFKKATKQLDKAAAKGVIHRNQAARKKSQLARLLKSPAKT
jgi:small subunit ribosomal protein S20